MQVQLKHAAQRTALFLVGGSLSLFLGLVAKVVVAKNTTKEEFGIYSLSVAIITICALFATLGIHEGVTRQVSISIGGNKKNDASSMARVSLHLGMLSASIFFLILFLFSEPIASYIFCMPQLASPLRIISFFIPLSVLIQIKVGILRGHGLIWPQICQGVGQGLVFLCAVAIFFFLEMQFISVIYAYLLSGLVALLMISGFGNDDTCSSSFSLYKEEAHHYVTLLKFSLPLMVVNMTGVVLSSADSLILGRYTGASDVGSYNVSISLARILEFPIVALAFVFMPIAGELFAKRQFAELKKTYQILTKWIFFVTLPFFFILFCFPEITILLLFGSQFASSALPLRILSLGFMMSAFLGVNGVLLVVLGMSRPLMHVNVFGMLLNVALNLVFIKGYGYGVIGAATASMISIFIMNLMASVLIYRESNIHPITVKYLKSILAIVVIAVLLLFISYLFPITFWLLPLYFLLFILGSIVILVVTRTLDHEDIALLRIVSIRAGFSSIFFEKWLHGRRP